MWIYNYLKKISKNKNKTDIIYCWEKNTIFVGDNKNIKTRIQDNYI